MLKRWIGIIAIACVVLTLSSCKKDEEAKKLGVRNMDNPMIQMKTSLGSVVIELYEEAAPISVENFIMYAKEGYYEGTVFHRVISGFMVQGGGFEPGMKQKEPRAPIKNEAKNGLKNERGTLAMARTNVVDSATSQFFINIVDNSFLDYQGDDPAKYGYAVFGKVIKGMDIVDLIKDVKTTRVGYFSDVPEKDVLIEEMKILQK